LLFLSDLLRDNLVGVTPSILAAFSDISGGGEMIPELSTTTDCRRELVLPDVLDRLSDTDFDRDNGLGAPNMLVRPLDNGGLSAFSDEEPFDESFSSLSDDLFVDFDRFKSESFDFLSSFASGDSSERRSLDDFFSSFRGAAPHAAQEDPSRTTRGRSFFEDLESLESLDSFDSFGSGGGVGGPTGAAFSFSGSLSLLDDLLLLDFLSTGISTASTVSSSSAGKLPGTSFDLKPFFGHTFFSSKISLSFLDGVLRLAVVCDFERLDFFLSSMSGGGGGGGGGGLATSTTFCASNAFNLSAIFPPTGFFVTTDAFIDVDVDFKEVVVSLGLVASGSFALSAIAISSLSVHDASFLAASVPLLDFLVVAPQNAKGSGLSSFSLTGLRSIRDSGSGSLTTWKISELVLLNREIFDMPPERGFNYPTTPGALK
jgi:hypothetical protein